MAGLDRLRLDAAGGVLAPVPFAPSRTAARLAGWFGPAHVAGIEVCCARDAEFSPPTIIVYAVARGLLVDLRGSM